MDYKKLVLEKLLNLKSDVAHDGNLVQQIEAITDYMFYLEDRYSPEEAPENQEEKK
jgi:hypothetical protein